MSFFTFIFELNNNKNTEIMIGLFNESKGRKATENETAKYLLQMAVDRFFQTLDFDDELGLTKTTDKERKEIIKYYEKHEKAFRQRLNVRKIFIDV